MIGKIKRGSSFRKICEYLLNPDKADQPEIISGNLSSSTPESLAAEFAIFAALNGRVKMTVKHFSLSFAPEDGVVSNDVKRTLAADYIDRMGYGDCQYLVVSHSRSDHDHDHDHIHIVANAVGMDGKWVNDWMNWKQSQTILRDLEKEYELTPVTSSWDKARDISMATRADRRVERQLASGVKLEEIDRTHGTIQDKINLAASAPTISQFCMRLQALEVETIPRITRTGKVQGFSYKLGDVVTRGSDLDNASFPMLQSIRGIRYDPDRDLANLRKLGRREKLEIHPDELREVDKSREQAEQQQRESESLRNFEVIEPIPVETDPSMDLDFDGLIEACEAIAAKQPRGNPDLNMLIPMFRQTAKNDPLHRSKLEELAKVCEQRTNPEQRTEIDFNSMILILQRTRQESMDILESYRSIDLEELREWYQQAAKNERGTEYLEKIAEIGKTLRDWQEDNSVGWDKVQEIDLEDIQRQMAIDKSDFQKSAPVVKVHMEVKVERVKQAKPKQSRGFSR
jgi:Relaxase/Mobilisation nuclease domain